MCPKRKEEDCARKTNLLVYKKSSSKRSEKPCHDHCNKHKHVFTPPICAPQPKQIRVCTGAELKKMCPPKLCKCPKPTNRLWLMFVFGVKTAIATGAMWVTYDLGVWGTTQDTHEMYKKYCTLVGGGSLNRATKWDPPSCEAESGLFPVAKYDACDVPPFNIERKTFTVQNRWNHAIETVFSGIAGFPFNLANIFESDKKEDPNKCDGTGDELIENKYKGPPPRK